MAKIVKIDDQNPSLKTQYGSIIDEDVCISYIQTSSCLPQPDRDDYPSVREIVQLIMHDTFDEMSLTDLYEEYKDWIAFNYEDN